MSLCPPKSRKRLTFDALQSVRASVCSGHGGDLRDRRQDSQDLLQEREFHRAESCPGCLFCLRGCQVIEVLVERIVRPPLHS